MRNKTHDNTNHWDTGESRRKWWFVLCRRICQSISFTATCGNPRRMEGLGQSRTQFCFTVPGFDALSACTKPPVRTSIFDCYGKLRFLSTLELDGPERTGCDSPLQYHQHRSVRLSAAAGGWRRRFKGREVFVY